LAERYAEYYFCDAYWPAFQELDFLRAILTYQQRHANLSARVHVVKLYKKKSYVPFRGRACDFVRELSRENSSISGKSSHATSRDV
jgi:hypothetical protein